MEELDNELDPLEPAGASTTPTTPGGLRDSLSSFADAYSQHVGQAGNEAEDQDQEAAPVPTPAEHFGAALDTVAGAMRANDLSRGAPAIYHGYSGRYGGDPLGGAATAALMNAGTRPRGTVTSFCPGADGVDQLSPGTTPMRSSVDF